MKVYEAIAQAVVDEGVDRIFTLMGDANMEMLTYLAELNYEGVCASRHEGAAMAMADGYARATGKLTVCTVTAGPGFANAVTSLTGAARANAPVVLITGQHSRENIGHPQWMDHEALTRVTGAAYRPVASAAGALDVTRAAFLQARMERMTVVLDVPMDIQDMELPWPYSYTPSSEDTIAPPRPHPDPATIAEATAIIASSERPIVIAGAGAVASGAVDAIRTLASTAGALLSTTLLARGLFSGDQFDIGVAGLFATDLAGELFAKADCVIAIGSSLNHYTVEGGYLFPNARVIHVDVRPAIMGSGRRPDCTVLSDARVGAEALTQALTSAGGAHARYRTADVADSIATRAVDDSPVEIEPDRVDPRRICAELDQILPDPCGLAIGVGHFWAFPIMHMNRRHFPLLFAHQFGAIGQSLPIAAGASVGLESTPMVLVDGDASVMLGIHALETLAVYRCRLLVVVLNDWALGAEYHRIKAAGHDPMHSTVPATDIAAVAQSMGCRAMTITHQADLKPAVEEFLRGDGPMVLDCRVSRNVVSRPFRRLFFAEG